MPDFKYPNQLQARLKEARQWFSAEVADFLRSHPHWSVREVARRYGVCETMIRDIAREHAISRPMGRPKKLDVIDPTLPPVEEL